MGEICKSCSNSDDKKLEGPPVPLRIKVVSARGLRNADFIGKSDPYCICEVTGRPDSKFETVTIDGQLNPEWNHEADVVGYHVGDSLTFSVKDRDPLKPDDSLGSVTLETDRFWDTGFDGELPLVGAGQEAFLKIKIEVVQPRVKVTIVGARGLRNADWVGKSDPYCICEIPGKSYSKFLTEVVNNCLNPEWNHEADVSGYAIEDPLTFTVKDKDPMKKDDALGSITLMSDQFLASGFEGELQLSGAGTGAEAFLRVKVIVNPEPEPAPARETSREKDMEPALVQKPPKEEEVAVETVVESKFASTWACC